MAQIIRLLDYEPVARANGYKPTEPATILFFTGVRYEKVPSNKKKINKVKRTRVASSTRLKRLKDRDAS